MKTAKKNIEIIRGGDLKESPFSMKPGEEAHLFAILRDQLYSDKVMAVVREYSTNAADAHIEAGKPDLPILVKMPTPIDPSFSIRDFGTGLTEEEIRQLYVMYGASTKRGTNEAIGQFGLGCKSGFAYSDQFMVISYTNGEKKTYTAYIDETNVGKIALLSTEETDEDDGVEIRIAVKVDDINTFCARASHLYSFFDVKPKVLRLPEQYKIKTHEYWLEGKLENGVKWGLQERNDKPMAIMGGIPYPIDALQFDFDSRWNYVLDRGLHIWFRIGDVQMAAHREGLEYNDRTKKHIKLVIKNVIDKVSQAAEKKIKEAKTYRDACVAFNKLKSEDVFRVFAKNMVIKWRGESIDGTILKTDIPGERWDPAQRKHVTVPEPDTKLHRINITRRYRGGQDVNTLVQNFVSEVYVTEDVKIVEVDTTNKWRIKVEYWLTQQKSPTTSLYGMNLYYAVAFKDKSERDKMFRMWHLDEWDITKVSDLPDPPASFTPSTSPTMSKKEKKKHSAKVFKLKDDFLKHPDRKSDNWEIVDIDLDDDDEIRYYVEIDHFFPILWKQRRKYSDLSTIRNKIHRWGIDVSDLFGLKPPMVKKVKDKDHWVRIDEEAEIQAKKRKPELLRRISRDQSLSQAPLTLKSYSMHLKKFPKGSPIRELLEYYKDLLEEGKIKEVDCELIKVLELAGINVKKEAAKELDRLLDAVRARYPLLSSFRIFPDGFHHYLNRSQVEAVIQYVNIVERECAEDDDDF